MLTNFCLLLLVCVGGGVCGKIHVKVSKVRLLKVAY